MKTLNQILFYSKYTLNLLLLLTLCPFYGIGQNSQQVFEPKILVLSPRKTSVTADLEIKLKAANDTLARQLSKSKERDAAAAKQMEGEPQNIKLMAVNSLAYLQRIDFFKEAPAYTASYLTYRFFERFPNVLVLLKDTVVSAGTAVMQKLARKENMAYIVNFTEIALSTKGGQPTGKMTVQLYEQASDSFLIDQVYTGNEHNQGFEFNCSEGTINCPVNNALSKALPDILQKIAENNKTLIRQRELSEQREQALATGLFRRPYDISLLKQAIPGSDKTINLKLVYQCLYSKDSTKFVAFFMKTGVNNNFRSLQDAKSDGKVNIETDKNISDKGYLDSIPKTYAYIVKGIKYNGKWYYEKQEVTYFDAPSLKEGQLTYLTQLEGWGYFGENTTAYDPGFWNGRLFEKITDRKKDPNWEKYKDMWATEERENRAYIGLYALVADKLKEEKQLQAAAYRQKFLDDVLQPFLAQHQHSTVNHIAKFDTSNTVLIYPKDKHVILIPVSIANENGAIAMRYFVNLPTSKQIFEWTYLTQHTGKQKRTTADAIVEDLSTITQWNYSYSSLDDDNFWDNDILLKRDNKYVYLTELIESGR